MDKAFETQVTNQMTEPVYYDYEQDEIVSLSQLKEEYKNRYNNEPDFKFEYPRFYNYLDSSLIENNGTLQLVSRVERQVVAIGIKKSKYYSWNPLDIERFYLDEYVNDYFVEDVWEFVKNSAIFTIEGTNNKLVACISSDGRKYLRSDNTSKMVDVIFSLPKLIT